MKRFFYSILLVALLPFVLIVDVIRSSRAGWKKAVYILLVLILFLTLWIGAVTSLVTYATSLLFSTGLRDELTEVQVSGTSMLPTIKDGATITLHNPKKYGLDRSDMVSFMNPETAGLYYLKRIVGLPGEKIVIKNGQLYINGKLLSEPYTLNNLPTFGNTFLTECEEYTVPQNHFAVFGDNRTVSQDSRVVGFVAKEDIEGVIKAEGENASFSPTSPISVSKKTVTSEEFLKALNAARTNENVSSLVTHNALNTLAETRAKDIKDNFDTWKKKDLSLETLLDQQGYKFNQIHEYVTFGYLNAEDIVNQILDSKRDRDHFLSTEFTEVGIGVTERTVGECTYPVVSVILSWPSIPTYDPEVISSWSEEITVTNKILSDLQSWVGNSAKNQAILRNTISLTAEENQIARRIHTRMTSREWLTQDDYADIRKYDTMVSQSNALLNELFPDVKGMSTLDLQKRRL